MLQNYKITPPNRSLAVKDDNIGSNSKSGNAKSQSFSSTVWVTEGEWHQWKLMRDKLCNITGESHNLLQFRSVYVGNVVRIMSEELGIKFDELVPLLAKVLNEYKEKQESQDVISESLFAEAVSQNHLTSTMRERDEALLKVLELKGLDGFVEWARRIDENFDHIAWLKRAGYAYELPWKDRVTRLLLAYFAQNGPQKTKDVIEWARNIGIIDNKDHTIAKFTKLGSEAGFSSAGGYGCWDVPDSMRNAVPDINIENYKDGETTIMELFGIADSISVVKK